MEQVQDANHRSSASTFNPRNLKGYGSCLKEINKTVVLACSDAGVAPDGFYLDDSFCDFGDMDTTCVADLIVGFAERYGDFKSDRYLSVVNALCLDATNSFSIVQSDSYDSLLGN